MLMRTINLLFSLGILFIFTSCQKELSPGDPSNPGTPPAITSKIKTYTEDVTDANGHTVVTFNVNYDASNKVTSLVSTSNTGDKFVYQYTSNSFVVDLYNSGALSVHDIIFTNNNGFPDSAFQYNDTNDTTTDKYYYNSSNQLIKDIEYDYSTGVSTESDTYVYDYDANGNVSSVRDDFSVTTFDYYTDKINNISLPGPPPLPNKNPVKTTTYDDGSGDIVVIHHTYTFDSSNRILTETDTADNGDVGIKTYTYY